MLEVRIDDRDIFSPCSVQALDNGSRQPTGTCTSSYTVLQFNTFLEEFLNGSGY